MGNAAKRADAEELRNLPSIDEVLGTDTARKAAQEIGQRRLTRLAREAVESLRSGLRRGDANPEAGSKASRQSLLAEAVRRLDEGWNAVKSQGIRRVINATGVVIHTNLGRAPLSTAAREVISRAAAGYCTLEYDTRSGKRGRRGALVESLLCELTGAEAALMVNNCAAAALLVLTVIARGGEVIVSRGELVEIGGDFRVPDVLVQSGAVLHEVGTTNRTKKSDYESAIRENTTAILRVHPSNYRIIGFTETPPGAVLAEIAHRNGLVYYEDAGSGALVDLSKFGLGDEPLINRSIDDGADIVTFSGDKLLGGPQAGLIVGRADLVGKIRKHPLYRALRADKIAAAAMEATLLAYARDTHFSDIPVLRMIAASSEELESRTRAFAERLTAAIGKNSGIEMNVVSGNSAVGGGSAPGIHPATSLIVITMKGTAAEVVESRLRSAETPVIARIIDDRVAFDLRTVDESDEAELLNAIQTLAA